MKGKRALAVLLTLSMLSACGGGARPQIEERFSETTPEAPASEAAATEAAAAEDRSPDDLSGGLNAVPAAHRGDERRYPHHHDDVYEEPSPEAQRVAEAALILTGAAFVCTFVVVVLDGACEFGAGFGYHYY